tara:strand:- start:1185 stop:1514 length:330 start_codon:yes stop_codon:yes gene_type:complete
MDLTKFPIINKIKSRMKKRDDITDDQVKGYNRRVLASPVFQEHVELLQEIDNQRTKLAQLCLQKDDEIKHLNLCVQIQSDKAKKAEKFLVDEFGTKSREYQQYELFVFD